MEQELLYEMKRSGAGSTVLPEVLIEDERDSEEKKEPCIICRFCSHVITTPETMMEVDGGHCHTFTNPLGITYSIGCFSSAKGCVHTGDPTMEYTWFPGYFWEYALCGNCYAHLGWHYRSEGSRFYGLILDNLTENL
ncbi:MAG TPA: cereblon family protein [Spirochaetota bacterium]|nr:cereblon family protein [Spirochaetota bacterium]HPJ39547.1 cereblon family protein [Spirochaetota bacterium]